MGKERNIDGFVMREMQRRYNENINVGELIKKIID
jgi:hypothetical protein